MCARLSTALRLQQAGTQAIEVERERRVDDFGGIADRLSAGAGEHTVDGVGAKSVVAGLTVA